MTARPQPDWVSELDALNPKLLDEYRDDPRSLNTIFGYLSRFPNADERNIALETLANARIRFDDPLASVFMGLHELNVRMMARQFRGVFSDAQALTDRTVELRKSTADLTRTISVLATEVREELGKVAGMPTELTDKLRATLERKLQLLDATAGAGIDNLEAASQRLLELTGQVNQSLTSLATDLGKRLDETSTVIVQSVDKKVGMRLDEILAKIADATNTQAKNAAEEALAEIVESINGRAKNIDSLLEKTQKDLTARLGSIDMRTVALPPLVQRYLDVATLPKSVVTAGIVLVVFVLIVGIGAGFRYGQTMVPMGHVSTVPMGHVGASRNKR